MESTGTYLVYCTVGAEEKAKEIGRQLVTERLAACVNIVPGLFSIYRWKGEVETDEEVLLLLKTTAHRFGALEKRLRELHPYETPEIIATEIREGSKAYLDWIGDSVLEDGHTED